MTSETRQDTQHRTPKNARKTSQDTIEPHDVSSTETPTKKPANPKLILSGLLVGMVGLGLVIQAMISQSGLFDDAADQVVAPPIPVTAGIDDESMTIQGFDIEGDGLTSDLKSPDVTTASSDDELPLTMSSDNEALEKAVATLADEFLTLTLMVQSLNQSLETIKVNQAQLLDVVQQQDRTHVDTLQSLQAGVKNNERWLGGLSRQLTDMKINIEQKASEFPVVVYSKNTWGEDTFLTVAPVRNPEQTNFLRVGDFAGNNWKLIDIADAMAVFQHQDGSIKELSL